MLTSAEPANNQPTDKSLLEGKAPSSESVVPIYDLGKMFVWHCLIAQKLSPLSAGWFNLSHQLIHAMKLISLHSPASCLPFKRLHGCK